MNFFAKLIEWIVSLLASFFPQKPLPPPVFSPTLPAPITRKVLMVIHNPVLHTKEDRSLREVFGWSDPDKLTQTYIDDLRETTGGYANFKIVERVEVDGFPLKSDSYCYDEASFLDAWQMRQFHQPDAVDYLKLVEAFGMIDKVNSGAIDEVWLFGFPYCGYYESIMAGPGAFWCNAPALKGTERANRKFVIMGFNYERGVGEMHESFGHRAESIMEKVYAGKSGDANLWKRFIRYDKTHPGQAECGNVHYAPNSAIDYDWGNSRPVMSRADRWLQYPVLTGEARTMDTRDWGGGEIRAHHTWWFRHFPHFAGEYSGVARNWWQYVVDPNTVPEGFSAFAAEAEPERVACQHGFEALDTPHENS
ncbi:MAG: hypothetical protein H7175_17845 [Burkholderiales bacterium]|nr:hypothetical protein [Anaerolineae bacterium]